MSVHKVPDSKGGGWEVRWRQAGRQRSKTIHDEDQAHIFDADVRRRRRLGTLADLDAGTELLRDWAVEWRFKSAENRLAARRSTATTKSGACTCCPDWATISCASSPPG